jgi:hypothetical protein
VVHQQAEEERLVAVVQGREADELLQVVGLAAEVAEHARHLLVLGAHVGRQQPAQAQEVALPPR